jgi:hypothetical protein
MLSACAAVMATPPIDEAPRQAPEEITLDKLEKQFREVAFKTEAGKSIRLSRWPGSISLRLIGPHTPDDRAAVEDIIRILGRLTGRSIGIAQDGTPANLLVRFSGSEEIRRAFKGTVNCRAHLSGAPGAILYAEIDIPNNTSRTRHCLAEEITQALGLPNDTRIFSDSLFNDDTPVSVVAPTMADSILVETLYDPRVRTNTTPDEVMPVVRRILAEKLSGEPTPMTDADRAAIRVNRQADFESLVEFTGQIIGTAEYCGIPYGNLNSLAVAHAAAFGITTTAQTGRRLLDAVILRTRASAADRKSFCWPVRGRIERNIQVLTSHLTRLLEESATSTPRGR